MLQLCDEALRRQLRSKGSSRAPSSLKYRPLSSFLVALHHPQSPTRMLRAAIVAALVGSVAQADTFGTFTPRLSVYVNNNQTCFNNVQPTLVVDGSAAGWQGERLARG